MLDIEMFKERALAEALSLTGAQHASTKERGMAARVAAELLDHVRWTETRAADVVNALRRCVVTRFDAFSSVEALVDVLRRKEGHRAMTIAMPLGRVARSAFEHRKFMSLRELLLVMLDDEVLSHAIEPAWVDACVRWHLARAPYARDPAGAVLALYRSRFGADHDWITGVVRDHHRDILGSHWLDFEAKQDLHYVAPTSDGWIYFAEFVTTDVPVRWHATRFAGRLPAATESLSEAIAELRTLDSDAAKSVVLAGWLSQLAVST